MRDTHSPQCDVADRGRCGTGSGFGRSGTLIEQRIATTHAAFVKQLGVRARARVLLEASTESEWVARCIEALGREVTDTNFAPMYATRSRKIKTDRRDARALCEG